MGDSNSKVHRIILTGHGAHNGINYPRIIEGGVRVTNVELRVSRLAVEAYFSRVLCHD